jgi:hypothetical protein
MRPERRAFRVERSDRLGVGIRPGLRPDSGPANRGGARVYLATSIARLSRITITLT